MENELLKTLLVKYITGEADDTEVQKIKHWLSLHPENEQYFIELYEAWQNMLLLEPELINTEKAYQAFLTKVTPEKKTIRLWSPYGKIAAAIMVGVLTLTFFLSKTNNKTEPTYQIVEAKKGTTLRLTLADSTIVYLNSGSKLRYETTFGKKNRNVYLDGEAFFDIGHKVKNMPFIVYAKNYVIRDIGTKFNLKAYANDAAFETTVIKGEVSVEGKADNTAQETNRIYLKPHQILKIYAPAKDERTLKQTPFNEVQVALIDSTKLQIYDGWKDNLLVFEGSTLSEIAKILERRYDVTISIDNQELQNLKYSGSFKNVADINKVLQIIQENTPISYTIKGQMITITKN